MPSMPIFLDKLLTLFAMPLGIAVLAGLLGLVALAIGRRGAAAPLYLFAFVWLWGWSTSPVAFSVNHALTDRYPFQPAEALPAADAIVVLDNTYPNPTHPTHPDLSTASDRAWHAARLYLAGKAPLVIISAGSVWGHPNAASPASATRTLLEALGVPSDAIVIEDRSRNTRQNALYTAKLAADRGITKVLLSTSAFHMTRAEGAFRQVGFEVIPAATDYVPRRPGSPLTPLILRLLPDVGALERSTMAYKEHVGLLVYRLRGWA